MSLSDKDIASFQRDPVPTVVPRVKVDDPSLQQWIDSITALVQTRLVGRDGNMADKAITFREQFRAGLIKIIDGGTVISGPVIPPGPIIPGNGDKPTDNLPPPAPTGLTATGGITSILLEWDEFDTTRVAYTEIWSAGTDNLGLAVKIGTAQGVLYADAVGSPGLSRYYWIRFVAPGSLGVVGPYNAVGGTLGQTGQDASSMLDLLAGQISTTELAGSLNDRIDLIDGNGPGSVNVRIQTGDDALSQQISLLTAGANQTFDAGYGWYFDSSAESWTATNATLAWAAGWLTYTGETGVVSLTSPTFTAVSGSQYQQVRFRMKRKAGTGWGVTLRWYRSGAWYSVTVPDATIADETTETVLVDLADNTDWIGQSITRLELQLDSATGSVYEVDWIAIGRDGPAASFAALQNEITLRTSGDSALATNITTLQATVDGNTAAISTEATARATQDGYLYAQRFVKIDLNGYIVGYGIAASDNPATGTPSSDFIVRVGKFSIVPPTGATGATVPFVFVSEETTVNGVVVPVGLYLTSAFISNGSIVNAKIGTAAIDDAKISNVSAAKITAGSIAVGEYIQSTGFVSGSAGWRILGNGTAEFAAASIRGQLIAAQINTNGLIIRDNSGNPLFGAGVPLSWSNITGQPAEIYNQNITIAANGQLVGGGGGQVTLTGLGAGAVAYLNGVTDVYISSVGVNKLIAGSLLNWLYVGPSQASGWGAYSIIATGGKNRPDDGIAGSVIGKDGSGNSFFEVLAGSGATAAKLQLTSWGVNNLTWGNGRFAVDAQGAITAANIGTSAGGSFSGATIYVGGGTSFTEGNVGGLVFPSSTRNRVIWYSARGHLVVSINWQTNGSIHIECGVGNTIDGSNYVTSPVRINQNLTYPSPLPFPRTINYLIPISTSWTSPIGTSSYNIRLRAYATCLDGFNSGPLAWITGVFAYYSDSYAAVLSD